MFYKIASLFAVVGQVGFAGLLLAGAVGLPEAPPALIVTSLIGVASGLLLMIWHLNFRFRGEDRERDQWRTVLVWTGPLATGPYLWRAAAIERSGSGRAERTLVTVGSGVTISCLLVVLAVIANGLVEPPVGRAAAVPWREGLQAAAAAALVLSWGLRMSVLNTAFVVLPGALAWGWLTGETPGVAASLATGMVCVGTCVAALVSTVRLWRHSRQA